MKQKIKRGLLYLAIGFVALFCLRLAYGYVFVTAREVTTSGVTVLNTSTALSEAVMTTIGGRRSQFSRGNYATEKFKVAGGDGQPLIVDQKYERVADIAAKTRAFDEDEKRVRHLTREYNGLIQFEQSSGLSGNRRLDLAIGVPPARFDPMVAELKEVGELASIGIDKTDKTNDYKELKANRASLEKTRDALVSLKSKGGKIEEFTNLENRILEIEEEIQSTGVSSATTTRKTNSARSG